MLLNRVVKVSALLLLCAAPAAGQSAIAGLVRDTSGAVLPGVTVEATSPSLIVGTRAAVTDGTGQYGSRIFGRATIRSLSH